MEATKLLLLLFSLQGGTHCDPDKPYCTEQLGTITVEVGGSVTIPCNFSYPKTWDSSTEVRVYWRHGSTSPCGNNKFIYNHTENWTHEDYRGRISMVGNPREEKTATIRIQNLKRVDGPMFCCRVIIIRNGGEDLKGSIPWQNRHGTFIQFKDQFSIEQTDVVPAVVGEVITVPCYVRYRSNDIIREVTWRTGRSDLCSDNNNIIKTWTEENKSEKIGRWSVVNFPEDLSLQVTDVTSSDSNQYCCDVTTRTRNSGPGPAHGTEVVVADPNTEPEFRITQNEISGEINNSVTIPCSFSTPPDRDPMWIGIYWRVGSPSGVYAYHPSREMVDPRYRGRTELRGPADLHIKGAQENDYAIYYCFVMLKFCVGNNNVSSVIQYGNGTRLNTKAMNLPDNSQTTLIIALAAAMLIVVILSVILIVLKKRGVICKKERGMEDMNDIVSTPNIPRNSPYMEIPNVRPHDAATGEENSGGVIYADLNVTSFQQGSSNKRKENKSDSDPQVLYATIKPTVG